MIEFRNVTKGFDLPDGSRHLAVDRLDIQIQSGETLCLLGASGSGKTTVLRLINRLLDTDQGTILIDGLDQRSIDPVQLRRSMGYVVQRGALFPHLTVFENVALMCRVEGWESERIQARVKDLLELVRMPAKEFARRYPNELSGGQRQRIGVARALALDPPIVLLDEPFGALDPITRGELQTEFQGLQELKKRTRVLVTHDMGEAFLLADRIALMEAGRILQIGTPKDLAENPASQHVADFLQQHSVSP